MKHTVHPIFRFLFFIASKSIYYIHDFRRAIFMKKGWLHFHCNNIKWKFYLGQKRVDLPFVIVKIYMSFYRIHRTHKMVANRLLAVVWFGWWASVFFCAPVHTYIRFAAKQTAESESFSTFCLRCWFLVSIIFTWQFRHNLLCFLSFSAFSKANALLFQSITTITFFALYSPTIVNYHFNTSPPLLIAAISASIHDCNPNTDFHWIISHFSHTTSFCKQQNQSNHSSVSTRLILNRLNLENLH